MVYVPDRGDIVYLQFDLASGQDSGTMSWRVWSGVNFCG